MNESDKTTIPRPEGPDVGLSFVDLLYAVPVAVLATRITETDLSDVRASGWTDVALVLAAVTFGWIGHHTNRQKQPQELKELRRSEYFFSSTWFAQFLVEVLIIVAYLALGTRILLPDGHGVGSPDEYGKALCLSGIFALYLVWDLLDIRIAWTGSDAKHRATHGMWVTLGFLGLSTSFLVVGLAQRDHDLHSVVAFDLAAILFLYSYRAVQERVVGP